MQQNDPRNIFFNQRQQYETKTENTNHSAPDSQPSGQHLQGQFDGTNAQSVGTAKGNAARNNGVGTDNGNNGGGGAGSASQTYEERVAEMKHLAAKYQREGEGQLVKDIVNSVIEQKASGKLTNEQLLAFAKRISPLLNSEQRSRLNGLVEQLLKL